MLFAVTVYELRDEKCPNNCFFLDFFTYGGSPPILM